MWEEKTIRGKGGKKKGKLGTRRRSKTRGEGEGKKGKRTGVGGGRVEEETMEMQFIFFVSILLHDRPSRGYQIHETRN